MQMLSSPGASRVVVLLAVVLVASVTGATPGAGHSWYPWECCHDQDCAPVDRVQSLPEQDSVFVTSRVGNAMVPASFPKRESKDGRMHVCLRKEPTGATKVICVFVPPQS